LQRGAGTKVALSHAQYYNRQASPSHFFRWKMGGNSKV
jgi:hypothetical protein